MGGKDGSPGGGDFGLAQFIEMAAIFAVILGLWFVELDWLSAHRDSIPWFVGLPLVWLSLVGTGAAVILGHGVIRTAIATASPKTNRHQRSKGE